MIDATLGLAMTHRSTPRSEGFWMPAEWERHHAVWLAWPSDASLWQENLAPAQSEFKAFCEAIADVDPTSGRIRGERLHVLVPNLEAGAAAERALAHLPAQIHLVPFGDIWLRDTAPVFLKNGSGKIATVRFAFNGWGGKYDLPDDPFVAEKIAELERVHSSVPEFACDWILEGGSVEVDGEGTCLTSRQCLLNANRNPALSLDHIESELCDALGVAKILWLGEGLVNDHTDGHIDTIARFASPGVVLCMQARGEGDPNHEIYEAIAHDLALMTDARGRKLEVVRIPSPGLIANEDGEPMPASYLNFYIANSTVVVPVYGSQWDELAVNEIAEYFPDRRTVGLSALAVLTGGGAFHCISQQVPLGESRHK